MDRRDDQRTLALERANAVRGELARIRAGGNRGGATRAARIVQAGESGLRVFRVLEAIPGVGDERTRRMLRAAGRIDPLARVNEPMIGERRRRLLAGELLSYANRDANRDDA